MRNLATNFAGLLQHALLFQAQSRTGKQVKMQEKFRLKNRQLTGNCPGVTYNYFINTDRNLHYVLD
ncbi:hypothetical protein DZA29_21200 [Citrobacter gillenii]|jgi:hypothetical protein|nr:hypothetical protein DZA29_21200 [Citrobacter gillenii]